jgi:hypothetical protein
LSACVAEVSGYWMDKFSAKGVALYFRANPEMPQFNFDYDKVQQVVSNLLENALKFTAPGGTVWLTADLHVWERRSRMTTPVRWNGAAVVRWEPGSRGLRWLTPARESPPSSTKRCLKISSEVLAIRRRHRVRDWDWLLPGASFKCTKEKSGWKASWASEASSVSYCRFGKPKPGHSRRGRVPCPRVSRISLNS